MRVMLISGEYPSQNAGGIASIIYELCKEFDKKQIDYKILCTNRFKFKGRNAQFLDAKGVAPFYDITFGRNFRDFLKKEANNFDIFHFHLPTSLGPLLYSKELKNKRIVTFHTTIEGFNRYIYKKMPFKYLSFREKIFKIGYIRPLIELEKKSIEDINTITTVSEGIKSELETWYKKTGIKVVPNGIDTAEFAESNYPLEADKPKIMYVGRLTAQKGIFVGIDSLSQVKEDFELLIVGNGPLRYKLETYCSNKKIGVKFLGYVDREELRNLYSISDILLMPSFYEGLPVVGLEGACCGLPIAAVKGARVEDIVCDENRELIVKTGDKISLSKTVERLLKSGEERRKIGEKNRKNVLKRFSSQRMAEEYIQIYESLLP